MSDSFVWHYVMGTTAIKVLGVALGAAVLWAGATKATATLDTLRTGDKAPTFSAQGTDGKTHTLASLTKEGDVFLYFIKEGCPVNQRAAPHVTVIDSKYGGKPNIVGVYDGSVAAAKAWQKTFGAKYLVLSDPDLKIIRGYGIPYSPFLVSVGKDGKVSQVLDGLSPKELSKLNTSIAKSLAAKVVEMEFRGAPSGGG